MISPQRGWGLCRIRRYLTLFVFRRRGQAVLIYYGQQPRRRKTKKNSLNGSGYKYVTPTEGVTKFKIQKCEYWAIFEVFKNLGLSWE